MGVFFQRGMHLFVNVGFLTSDAPPVETLVQKAENGEWAWCGRAGSDDVHAMAFCVEGFFRKRGIVTSHDRLRRALLRLTACAEEIFQTTRSDHFAERLIPPNAVGIEHSPAMADIRPVNCRPTAFAPRFLNRAFMEIVSDPVESPVKDHDTEALSQALLKHRDRSNVPWIFNAMANEIEYRTGSTVPKAFPPEIHLSTTGMCNISCRFCGYEDSIARKDSLLPEMMQEMTYLRHVQTLRLSSGLGEPTLNPHLSEIIRFLSSSFPHLQLGFFTNGTALHRNGLLDALVGNVNWLSVSLNAASSESYRTQCLKDRFDGVSDNLLRLLAAKRERKNLMPLAMGSMVLNRRNLLDLPQMPALCRSLGIDRLTVFPFSALGAHDPSKFGPDDTLAACMSDYAPLYEKTVEASERHRVSLEIPIPTPHSKGNFGIPKGKFYDFARIESNEWPLGRFLTGFEFDEPEGAYCHFLWRYAPIGSANNTGHSSRVTHFLYPCVGPLSSVDLSRRTAFRFPDENGFLELWQHPVLNFLREAQHSPNMCRVCDFCRREDVRDPKHFERLEEEVGRFAATHREAPAENRQ